MDGKTIEIQVAPAQTYIYLQLKEKAALRLGEISFKSGESLSNPDTCACTQIKLVPVESIHIDVPRPR